MDQRTRGTVKNYDQKTKKLTAMTVDHLKSQIKPVVKGNRLSFKVNINSRHTWLKTGIQPKRQLTKNI
ncbi:hypothetical protein EMIT074MI3_11057 [Bacillus licheniformis]